MHVYGENIEKSVSENVLKTNGWTYNVWSKKQILLSTIKILTLGLSALAPGQYTCIKSS